jgi:hypothetical protein
MPLHERALPTARVVSELVAQGLSHMFLTHVRVPEPQAPER